MAIDGLARTSEYVEMTLMWAQDHAIAISSAPKGYHSCRRKIMQSCRQIISCQSTLGHLLELEGAQSSTAAGIGGVSSLTENSILERPDKSTPTRLQK